MCSEGVLVLRRGAARPESVLCSTKGKDRQEKLLAAFDETSFFEIFGILEKGGRNDGDAADGAQGRWAEEGGGF